MRSLALVAIAVVALLAVACGVDATPTPTPTAVPTPTPEPVVAAAPPSEASDVVIAVPEIGIQIMALHTAVFGGFFEAQGVSVTIVSFTSPMGAMRAARMGEAHFGVIPPIQVVNSQNSPPHITLARIAPTRAANRAGAGALR